MAMPKYLYLIFLALAIYVFLIAIVAVVYAYWETADDPPNHIQGDYPHSFWKNFF
jgi:hypothetical protein